MIGDDDNHDPPRETEPGIRLDLVRRESREAKEARRAERRRLRAFQETEVERWFMEGMPVMEATTKAKAEFGEAAFCRQYLARVKRRVMAAHPEAAVTLSNARVRRENIRLLAAEGHSARQIAVTLGIAEESCRMIARAEGIDIPAERIVGKRRRVDPVRVLDKMALDAEGLTADLNIIDFHSLPADRFPYWIDAFTSARKSLGSFIRQLQKEHDAYESSRRR